LPAQTYVLVIFGDFSRDEPETVNKIANLPNTTFLPLEAIIGTKTKQT
jgi:hypothetical protein